MATPLNFFKLFGDFLSDWPVDRIRDVTGWDPTNIDLNGWLAELNAASRLFDVRTAASVDPFQADPNDPVDRRVGLEARLALEASALRPGGLPFVLSSMPDVEFRVKAMDPAHAAYLFLSQGSSGVDLLLEGLPVEILLPIDLVQPHPEDVPPGGGGEHKVGDFTVGKLDSQELVLRKDERASIFVHMRVKVTNGLGVVLTPAVPISFGRCLFLEGISCLAVHDFLLIPSPELAQDHLDWIRHGIEPWASLHSEITTGCFAARTVHLDPDGSPTRQIADWLGKRNVPLGTADSATAQLVLDDLVMPFDLLQVPPLPRHITVGARRNPDNPLDAAALFDLEQAPIQLPLSNDPKVGLVIESAFYESQGLEAITQNLDLGLRLNAAIYFGDRNSPNNALTLGLGENLTPRLGYRRELDIATGPAGFELMSWTFFGITVDILSLTAGYSIGRHVQPHARFKDAVELLVDLWVSYIPSEKWLKLRTLDNAPPSFAVHSLGWKDGGMHLEGLALPDGFVWSIGDLVSLIFQEIGLASEEGVAYLSVSGGALLPIPKGFEGGLTVKRLRFPVEDKAGAPPFKLDGFFGFWRSDRVELEIGGFISDENVQDPDLGPVRRTELGFTGDLKLEYGSKKLRIMLDVLGGKISWTDDSFHYLLMQLILEGKIPCLGAELKGIRLLFANNMMPRLEPENNASGELRYYDWYQKSDPLKVPGSRRLAAWVSENDAWSLGLGCSIALTGLGSVAYLRAFALALDSPEEDALMVAVEFFALKAKEPIAWGILEIDLDSPAYKLQLGVEVTLETLADSNSDWLQRAPKLTGTLLIGNRPGTLALGRLADPRSWLSLVWDIDLWQFRTYLRVGFCLELVDEGPEGLGLTVRLEGESKWGVAELSYYVLFGFQAGTFKTGSKDQGLAILLEAAIRAVLFGFLRFGVSAAIELRYVCLRPARTELALRLRFETPWFLPDVTLDLEHASGEVQPQLLGLFTSPLQGGSAFHEATSSTLPIHVERWDTAWTDDLPAETHSIEDFSAGGLDETSRIQRFHANDEIRPIATDSTIAIDFSSSMNDDLQIGGVTPGQGNQASGDLSLGYGLVGFEIRRRPRFGGDPTWQTVEERIELSGDFSDPSGVELEGSIEPHEISKFWSPDVRSGSQAAAKRLLVNASTPFDYSTVDPYTDDVIIIDNPNWPCCPPDRQTPVHRVGYEEPPLGTSLVGPRVFTESNSRLRLLQPAVVRPPALPGSSAGQVAAVDISGPGVVARAELDADTVLCRVHLAWSGTAPAKLHLVAFDDTAVEAGRKTMDLGTIAPFQDVEIFGLRPFRRFELRAELLEETEQPEEERTPYRVEIFEAVYVTYQEWLQDQRDQTFCDSTADDFQSSYAGRGKLFLLPNHEYEVRVRSRLEAAHPSTDTSSTEVDEYLYFTTKGHPGLNAVERVGQEVEPYVRDVYRGGRGRVYREEPVALAFNEHYSLVVPVSERPPGTSDERQELLRLALTAQPDLSTEPETVLTTTSDDWIVAHWNLNLPPVILDFPLPWLPTPGSSDLVVSSGRAVDPRRARLGGLTQRSGTVCLLDDPNDVTTGVLIAQPQGTEDPLDPEGELWRADARFTAAVRPEGSPFVHREPFLPIDLSAFDFLIDGGAGGGDAWSVVDGELLVNAPSRQLACFGEEDWNHLEVHLEVRPNPSAAEPTSDSAVGIAFGLPTGNADQGLFALVETNAGARRLALYRRATGTQMELLAEAELQDEGETLNVVATAFDDRLRWSCGEVTIEIDRGSQRQGRLALVAEGEVALRSLRVAGLKAYEFSFQASRYRSFTDHIQSFDGNLPLIEPDALGATATETVGSLWTATADQIAELMAAGGSAEQRQRLFDRWTAGLVLPFAQNAEALEVSRYEDDAGVTALVIESPEPLDMIEEISVELQRRTDGDGPLDQAQLDQLEALAPDVLSLLAGSDLSTQRSAHKVAETPTHPQAGATLIEPLEGQGLRVYFDAALAGELRPDQPIVALEMLAPDPTGGDTSRGAQLSGGAVGGDPAFRIWSGSVAFNLGGIPYVDIEAGERATLEPSSALGSLFADLPTGSMLFIDPDTGLCFETWWSLVGFETLEVSLLQDADARRIIVAPRSESATRALDSGRYRLRLTMERPRWSTTAAVDALNHYRSFGSLVFDL